MYGFEVPPTTELWVGNSGTRLHVILCPHLVHWRDQGNGYREREIFGRVANREERRDMTVCAWCESDILGVGRSWHSDIASALRELGVDHESRPRLQALLEGALEDRAGWSLDPEEYDVWVNGGRTYVAVAVFNETVAWASKTRVTFADGSDPVDVEGVHPSGNGGQRKQPAKRGATCPRCHTERSLAGVCLCDDR